MSSVSCGLVVLPTLVTFYCLEDFWKPLLTVFFPRWSRHRYSQYLTAQVIDSDGRPTKSTRSSFYHFLCRLEWVAAYRPQEGGQQETKYLCPNSVYLTSPEITDVLGTHVYYVKLDPSEFSRALGKNESSAHLWCLSNGCGTTLWDGGRAAAWIEPIDRLFSLSGMMQSLSVDTLITFLKKWCIKPAVDNQEDDELEGADFTSTVEHIHNVYTYLHKNCSQSSLKELFQHTPAVFVRQDYNR